MRLLDRSTGEITPITRQQEVDVVLQDIDLAAGALRLAGLETAEAEVVVQADEDALEELLGRGPGRREKPTAVGGDATDQVVRRHVGAVRPRIAVFALDACGDVQLAALVEGLLGTARLGQEGLLPVDEDEGPVDVGLLVSAGEAAQADAGLDPLRVDVGGALVDRLDLEADFTVPGRDAVVDDDVALDDVAEGDGLPVVGEFFSFMRDDGLGPGDVAGARAAVGLEVQDLDALAGELAVDGEDVLLPGKGQRGCQFRLGRDAAGHQEQDDPGGPHGYGTPAGPIVTIWG